MGRSYWTAKSGILRKWSYRALIAVTWQQTSKIRNCTSGELGTLYEKGTVLIFRNFYCERIRTVPFSFFQKEKSFKSKIRSEPPGRVTKSCNARSCRGP